MSKHESPLTRRYHQDRYPEGTLIEEFHAVREKAGEQAKRYIDGVIFVDGDGRALCARDAGPGWRELADRRVVCVQTKACRLGSLLLGQAYFSRELLRSRGAAVLKSVAICTADDPLMRELAETKMDLEIVVGSGPIKGRPRLQHGEATKAAAERYWGGRGRLVRDLRLVAGGERICRVIMRGDPRNDQVEGGTWHDLAALRDRDDLEVVVPGMWGHYGMFALGEALLGRLLLEHFGAVNVKTVLISERTDGALDAHAARHGITVVRTADIP